MAFGPLRGAWTLLALSVLSAPPTPADSLGRGVAGSIHDFRSPRPGTVPEATGGDSPRWELDRHAACRVCHGRAGAAEARTSLRWDRGDAVRPPWIGSTAGPELLAYVDSGVGIAPTGSSKLCLGCHDGVLGRNAYSGRDGGAGAVSRTVAGRGAAPGLAGSGRSALVSGHPISIRARGALAERLARSRDGRVQCSTCHDVHDQETQPGTLLLRLGLAGDAGTGARASALCLGCHDF